MLGPTNSRLHHGEAGRGIRFAPPHMIIESQPFLCFGLNLTSSDSNPVHEVFPPLGPQLAVWRGWSSGPVGLEVGNTTCFSPSSVSPELADALHHEGWLLLPNPELWPTPGGRAGVVDAPSQ